ncbi:MAG: putative metal-binding motif-containing protein, partial [Deltaproteobacteria bacterium]|nr:putative metal-binding motif-containing protein [Deltaproteobacteria bacterium]
SDPDCITWDVLFSIDVAGFGEADSASSFAAALGANCTDSDGDGWFAEGGCCGAADCDDSDPDVNPGAAEKCNDAKDNNCNNTVNEGCGCLAKRLFSRTDPGLKTLRRFRDEILYGSDFGTACAGLYYEKSAVLAALTEDRPALRSFFRGLFEALLPMLEKTPGRPD